MRDDEQDPAEDVSSPEALASALEYLHAEARLAGYDFVAHLILVAASAIEEELQEGGNTRPPPPRNYPPRLRLLQGGKMAMSALRKHRQGDRP